VAFSATRSGRQVPGMGTMTGEAVRAHVRATWAGVASRRPATDRTVSARCWSGLCEASMDEGGAVALAPGSTPRSR
jgi:hypothetical protein